MLERKHIKNICQLVKQFVHIFQARSILMLATREMEERLKTPTGSDLSSPTLQTEQYSPSTGLSMKRSLQRFLQKRKNRIQATSPYWKVYCIGEKKNYLVKFLQNSFVSKADSMGWTSFCKKIKYWHGLLNGGPQNYKMDIKHGSRLSIYILFISLVPKVNTLVPPLVGSMGLVNYLFN